jgi:hypothetical protein
MRISSSSQDPSSSKVNFDDPDVKKFELSEEEYAKRDDSVQS